MVRGQPLSDDLRKVILNMARHLDVPTIRHHTGCAASSIYMLLADYRQLGTVACAHRVREQRGKRHILVSEDVRVSGILRL